MSFRRMVATVALLWGMSVANPAQAQFETLLNQAPLGLALAHQGLALVVLTLASLHAARATPPQ